MRPRAGTLRTLAWIGALALVLAHGRPAHAAGGGGDAAERERTAVYAEGVALANAGKWEEAEKKFRRVVAIRSAPPALYTLAQAQEHTGQLATAERTYDAALASARATGNTEVAEAAGRAREALEPRVPRIVVHLAGSVPGAALTIDGASVGLEQPVKLDPGSHVIAARAPERRPFEERTNLAPGQSAEVTVRLEPVAEAPAAAPASAPMPASAPASSASASESPAAPVSAPGPEAPGHSGPLIVGGAGLAAVVAGVVVRIAAQSSYDDANKQCVPGGCPTSQLVDQGNSARTQMLVGTIIAGVGAAAVLVAGTWWLSISSAHDGATASVAARF
jgi:hypothetical protein